MLNVDLKTRMITEVGLSGSLDETSELKDKLKNLNGKVQVYARGIERANSFGLRMWITVWAEARKRGAEIEFYEISPVLISAMNIVTDFIPLGEVRSICAPYFCKACGGETLKIFSMKDIPSLNDSIPEAKCDRCGAKLDFNEHRDYFSFRVK